MSIQAQNWARAQRVGNSGAKFILWLLADYADFEGGSCYPSITTLAEQTEMGERTISRHLDYLEDHNFLTRTRTIKSNGTYGHYRYTLLLSPPARLATGQKTQKPPAKLATNPSIDPINKNNTLSREEFMRVIDEKIVAGEFDDLKKRTDLTDDLLRMASADAWD